MKKEEALRILFTSAEVYREHLENKNLLIIYSDTDGEYKYFETRFLRQNFKHLTGIKTELSSKELYKRLISHRLSVDDFSMAADGTTEMKLRILPQLFKFHTCARMIGELDEGAVMRLHTERLAGGITACMGFVQSGNYYVPNTALNKDIRDVTPKPQHRILTILKKNIADLKYNQRIYTAKGFEFNSILAYEEICNLIEFPV